MGAQTTVSAIFQHSFAAQLTLVVHVLPVFVAQESSSVALQGDTN